MTPDYPTLFEDWLQDQFERQKKIHAKPFIGSRNIHFDGKIQQSDLESNIRFDVCNLLKNSKNVPRHKFLQFIRKDKRERKYRYKPGSDLTHPKKYPVIKNRRIMYAGHKDACLYGFYGFILNNLYTKYLSLNHLEDNILAYRSISSDIRTGRSKSNIDFAVETVKKVWAKDNTAIIFVDISGFFDNINHSVLLEKWCSLLGTESLPEEHQAIYKSLTRFRWVPQEDIHSKLGITPKNFKKSDAYKRGVYCSPNKYNTLFKKGGLIQQNRSSAGIPQGSPISGILSNISLIGFDHSVASRVEAQQRGLYRRYSDDILILIPADEADSTYKFVKESLQAVGLSVNDEKTDIFL